MERRRLLLHFGLALVALSISFSSTPVFAKKARPIPKQKPRTIEISRIGTEADKLNAVLKFVSENEAQKHGWPANYKSLWCPTNVYNLLRRLEEAKVDLARAQVWYIVPQQAAQKTGENTLHPKSARPTLAGPVNEWSFHVVVQIDGRILDLDFTESPKIVSIPAYAAAMWRKGPLSPTPEDPQPLFVRAIPAREYLNLYSGNWSWFVAGASGRFPAVDLKTLL